MSVSGISSSNFLSYTTQSNQPRMQQFAQEFRQLGADLQSGNLSAAQADFANLQQTGLASSSVQNNSPIAQLFNQLSQDLESGHLSAAQQDYASIQQGFQNQTSHVHHRHHHGGGNESSAVNQLLEHLGQDLQAGNVSAAQQAYNTLIQDFPQSGQNPGGTSTQQLAPSNRSVSIIA
jgi:hypothetical protein